MLIQKNGFTRILILCLFLLCAFAAPAQLSPDMLNRAKAMGVSQADIDAALASQAAGGKSVGNPLISPTSGASQLLPGASSLSDTLNRKPFTIRDLDQINPVRLEKVISDKIDAQGHSVSPQGVPLNSANLENSDDDFPTLGSNAKQPAEYEIVIKDGQYIKRMLPQVFGREMFSNRNLTFAPNYNMATPKNYLLGAGDQLVVQGWGNSEFSVKQKITPDGTISIQGVGPISLVGMTIEEAEQRIKAKVSQVMGGTSVSVSLGQIRTIKVNIAGEVVVPGTFSLPSLSTVFNAIYMAGGVNKIGSLRNIKVYRDSREIATLDVYDYLINGRYETNIRLEDNDMIIVSPYANFVTVAGRVKRERIYEMKNGETLSNVVAFAGGFTGDAYTESLNVKRKTGRQYSILTVDNPDFGAFPVMDGDSVVVDKIIEEYANRVTILGAVWRPGEYQLSEKTNTLSALLAKAEGLKGNEFASRGQIMRLKSDYTQEVIPFDVRAVAEGTVDVTLVREDLVYIPGILDMREAYTIAVNGEVNAPSTQPYRDGMTIEDAIMLGGGLKESASLAKIEVARRIKDPNSTTYTDRTAEVFTFTISEDLRLQSEANRFILQPFDEVYIRRSPGYSEQKRVAVVGEVVYPGVYVLTTAGERISDLVKKSGGFSPEAYIRGASVRRRLSEDEKQRVQSMLKMVANSSGNEAVMPEVDLDAFYPIGIDVEAAVRNPGSSNDIILRDGDQLYVPKHNSVVKISGSVNYPNAVTFNNKNLRTYISQAGGYQENARRRPFVVYMNGKVAATRMRLFSKKYPVIEPGCEVVVPMKQPRSGQGLATTMGVMTSTASLAAMVASIISLSR